MEVIWKKYIEKSLPGNCMPPIYTMNSSPIGDMMKFLERVEKEGSEDVFVIYSDIEDIKKYTDKMLMPYIPTLLAAGQVQRRGVDRNETVNVSGTKMRQFIVTGDVKSFANFLPPALQPNAQKIYSMLAPKI
jgi:energy-coupling factor transporter ATP-binding protein EcfA2